MDGWNTIVSFWGLAYFQVRAVRLPEATFFSHIAVKKTSLDLTFGPKT